MADDSLAIFEKIAIAFADGREPDLSSFPPAEVRTAMQRVLQFPGPRHDFVAWLNGRVEAISEGEVSIEEREMAESDAQSRPGELNVRVLRKDEPFAEPAVMRSEEPVLQFPMRR